MFEFQYRPDPPDIFLKRCWKGYSKELLCSELSKTDFNIQADNPQSFWNQLEQKFLTITDNIVPYVPFFNNASVKSLQPNAAIKKKLNLRKKLIKISPSHGG